MSEFPYIVENRPLGVKIARSAIMFLSAALIFLDLASSKLASPLRDWAGFGAPLGFGLAAAALAVWPFGTELQSTDQIQRIGFTCLGIAAVIFASRLF